MTTKEGGGVVLDVGLLNTDKLECWCVCGREVGVWGGCGGVGVQRGVCRVDGHLTRSLGAH